MKVPISTARVRLFTLADLVRSSSDDTIVVLEQRGGGEGVGLVREARLAYLEDRVKQMDTWPEKPFTTAGSLPVDLDGQELEPILRDQRRTWVPAPKPRRK